MLFPANKYKNISSNMWRKNNPFKISKANASKEAQ